MTARTVDPAYVPLTVTTAAGVLAAAPQSTAVIVPAGVLEQIDVQIPPGHGGVTGIRFALAGQQILPWSNTASWIMGDDLRETFEVNVEVGTGLTVVTFNAGQYPHQHLLRFKVRQVPTSTVAAPVQLVPLDQLGGIVP